MSQGDLGVVPATRYSYGQLAASHRAGASSLKNYPKGYPNRTRDYPIG